MSDLPKLVVFLDIDGPMIPGTMLLANKRASWQRHFPLTTVAVINEFCRLSGARIVFNTTHNQPIERVPDIEVALVEQGLLSEYLHPTDMKTLFPSIGREVAVKEWVSRHPEVERFVAFDDVKFTDHKYLVHVDPDAGLSLAHINRGLKVLGVNAALPMFLM